MITTFHHTEHKKLWNFLAYHPDMDKTEAFEYLELNEVTYECFACDYAYKISQKLQDAPKNKLFNCKHCPLIWPYQDKFNGNPCNVLFVLWSILNEREKKTKRNLKVLRGCASQIASLPLKEGVITI